jgi:hypothetical protein
MIEKSRVGTLRRYEQARDLSISLLKDWLVKYKFKDWKTHSSSGKPVSEQEKETRAIEIAEALSNHKKWHSHGRMIGIKTLTEDLRLKIEDYTDNEELKSVIRKYSDLLLDCVQSRGADHMFHVMTFSEHKITDDN